MPWREFLLRALVLWGTAIVLITECLGTFHLVSRLPLLAAWLAAIGFSVWKVRIPPIPKPALRSYWFETSIAAAIIVIAAIVGFVAVIAPPNSADAMAYHMPRVVYWTQASSVAFFPTPYLNQIMLQPFAEYAMLHTYVLSGGDRLINLIQFTGFLGSILAVSLIAGALGLGSRGQAVAALFCATLPNGILQASSAKNDYFLSLWLASAIYFALRGNVVFLGLAAALTIGTKGTAYLFLPPLLIMALWRSRPPAFRAAAALATCTLLLNGPQYWRNFGLSGSILGYDSAQGDGFFRWRNEQLGWRATASNLLRHTAEQMGARSDRWNQAVYSGVIRIHNALGLDPQDPNTTWRWSRYEPPRNANHEANANNRWHLLLLIAAGAFALARRNWQWLGYGMGLLAAFVAFCFYLKWQPYLSRLELPLFVAASPLAAYLFESLRPVLLQVALCLFLVSNARLPLTQNWIRPLTGETSILRMSRESNYFADMGQWNNRDSYLESVRLVTNSGCGRIGIDTSENQLEYPFQALVLARNPSARFVHVGVENASSRYGRKPQVCAVLCLDCTRNSSKIARYSPMGEPTEIGRFLLWVRP